MPDTSNAQHELLLSLRRLPDDELVARLKGLTARERQATALLVAHLAELDTRDVYLRAGYSSLFTYCRDFLGLSDDEAYNRVVAARTARRFPVVLDLLAAGELNVTIVRVLGPHLTPENHLVVLDSARRKRKTEVEDIVARLSPRADVRASVRKVPQPTAPSLARGASESSAETAAAPAVVSSDPTACSRPGLDGGSGVRRSPRADSSSGHLAESRDSGGRPASDCLSPVGASAAFGRCHAALARPLPLPAHDRRHDAREAAAREGHASAPPALGRRRSHP